MRNNDDLTPLRKFKEDRILDLIEAAMQGKITLYVQSRKSSDMILLSPAHLQTIRSYHPQKVKIIIQQETHQVYNAWMERYSTQTLQQTQIISSSDLWINKDAADALLNPAVSRQPTLNESEKSLC